MPTAYNFIEKRLCHSCFSVNFAKIFRATILLYTLERVPLEAVKNRGSIMIGSFVLKKNRKEKMQKPRNSGSTGVQPCIAIFILTSSPCRQTTKTQDI